MKDQIVRNLLICPQCSQHFSYHDSKSLVCMNCNINVRSLNGLISLLDQDIKKNISKTRDQFIVDKNEIRQLYRDISESKKDSKIGKYSLFLNYGYAPNNNKQHSNVSVEDKIINKNSIKLFLEVIGESNLSGKNILEVGCGRGGNIWAINNYYAPNQVLGLDLSEDNILFCMERFRTTNAIFFVADAEHFCVTPDSMDFVINIESALHYPDFELFITNVHRVLNQKGIFCYADIIPEKNITSREKLFSDCGFAVSRKTNITSNVLLSLESKKGVVNIFDSESGPKLIDDLKEGILNYFIYNLSKVN